MTVFTVSQINEIVKKYIDIIYDKNQEEIWKNRLEECPPKMHIETQYFVSYILYRFSTEGIFKINTNKFESLYNSGYFNFDFENTPV